jgi:[acyl-carrier-protein] S-malonyltransferase
MIAVVFPGQGSQKPGMGKELYESSTEARAVFEAVGGAVGTDVAKLCFESDEETLRQTQNAQLALYTCGLAAWRALGQTAGVVATAGHSVGEYAALAAAGVLSLEDGARLVRTRGELMARSGSQRPGTMAAVLGLGKEDLEVACAEAGGVVVVANDNCPGQLVISGEVEAVGKAGELASAKGAKRVLPLNVSGAFHSPLMDEPAKEMAQALAQVAFQAGSLRVYSNVTSEPVAEPSQWPTLLENQLKSPVRWTESVQNMLRDGIMTFIECGGGEVLSGLIRRTDKGATTLSVGDTASLEKTRAALG